MYHCRNCNRDFPDEEVNVISMSKDAYYGVSGEFGMSYGGSIDVEFCPYCGREDVSWYEDDVEDDDSGMPLE